MCEIVWLETASWVLISHWTSAFAKVNHASSHDISRVVSVSLTTSIMRSGAAFPGRSPGFRARGGALYYPDGVDLWSMAWSGEALQAGEVPRCQSLTETLL